VVRKRSPVRSFPRLSPPWQAKTWCAKDFAKHGGVEAWEKFGVM